jgi:hypothetical protein
MVTVFLGVLVVLLSVLLAIIGQALVHRLVPLRIRESNIASIGQIYAALYVMFGVSLAFSLFLTASAFSAAQSTVEREAGSVESIYRLAGLLPEPERDRIQELAESYARTVVEEEWPLIGRGSESQPSPQAETLAADLEKSIGGFEPSTSGEQALKAQLLGLVDDLGDDRLIRLLESRQGLPSILWSVLVIGAILTVAFTSLFAVEPPWFHTVAVAGLTVIVVLILYTIYRIEYPFTGDVRVSPEAFEFVLDEIEGGNIP